MVKLLDFWAEWCIDPETPVFTENGYIKASQIQVGQRLVTIDPKTKKQAIKKVSKIKIFQDAQSKKITLETGRSLVGDINHLILTTEGFKRLEDLSVGEKILVNPKTSETFSSNDESIIFTTTENEYADKVLKQFNFLPLKSNDYRLPVIARLLGFVMTDGYLYEDLKHNIYETHFYIGTEQDVKALKHDLKSLGFDKLEIKRQVKERKIGNREFTISILRCRNLNRSLFFLLKALGSPAGRKKNQAYFIPDWIMNGDFAIKREFLRGWLGGDGCKIDYYIQYEGLSSHYSGFKINAIEFHKEKELEREGILYAQQLANLLEELGVSVKEVQSIDDEDGVIISLKILTDYDSLFNLAKIGYAYAGTKDKNVPFIKEFLAYRLLERNRYTELKQVVLQQLALGISNQMIAQNLQIPIHTVVSWRYNKMARVTHPSENGQARFDKWLEDRQQENLLGERVIGIDYLGKRDVIGITVDEPHTLITNGIISHNCGPCKIMEPVIEEIEKELKDKIEIEKINVDENPSKASEFGVMSIPTYVILKEGKEIGRRIGITAKAELVKLLQA